MRTRQGLSQHCTLWCNFYILLLYYCQSYVANPKVTTEFRCHHPRTSGETGGSGDGDRELPLSDDPATLASGVGATNIRRGAEAVVLPSTWKASSSSLFVILFSSCDPEVSGIVLVAEESTATWLTKDSSVYR